MANLISFGDLIGQSVSLYEKNWKKLTVHTLWLMVGVLVGYIPYLGLIFLSENQPTVIATLMRCLGFILFILCLMLPVIRLSLAVLKMAKGESAGEMKWNTITPILLPSLVVCLLEALLVLAGYVFLILPGIWLSVALGFSCYVFWDEGKKGFSAIKQSYQLVKGRWWATMVRLLVPGILVGFVWVAFILVGVLCLLVLSVLGLMLLGLIGTAAPEVANVLRYVGIALLAVGGVAVYMVPLVILTPLSMFPTVKVYLNLKSTR